MQQLKLRRMRVRGFKSLADFDLRFPDNLLILIGGNGAGKSSVLQALAFIQYFAKGQPKAFFEDRGWKPGDLRSRGKTGLKPNIISYRLLLEGDRDLKVLWYFAYNVSSERTILEKIWILEPGKDIPHKIVDLTEKGLLIEGEKIFAIAPEGSVVSILLDKALFPVIGDAVSSLKAWGTGIFSLELLSPEAMRRGGRGSSTDIGPRGERLAGFLASLSAAQKDRLVGRLMPFYPVQNIETTRKRAGWIDLRVAEAFESIGKTGIAHMSDGFLRLLGLASIPEFGASASTVLLDEVEDGIEPHILPRFISMIARESRVQLVLTSHSPVLVNAFDPSQIAFVVRRQDGGTVSAPFSSLTPLTDGLEYFGAGEVWSITDMNRIGELVVEASSAFSPKANQTNNSIQVKTFMGMN